MVDLSRVNRRELLVLTGLVVVTVVGVTVAVVLLRGGSVTGPDTPAAQPTSAGVTLTEIPVNTSVVKVAGTLPKKARTAAEFDIDVLLTTYVSDAYLGEYPDKSFDGTWSAFTEGITPSAKKDGDLLTGERWSGQSLDVRPGRLVAKVSVLARHKKPIGATAFVTFKFLPEDASGSKLAPVTVKGSLYLTRSGGQWQIFGYDVSAPGAAAATGGQQ